MFFSYIKVIILNIKTITQSLALTWRHIWHAMNAQLNKPKSILSTEYFDNNKGIMTLQYPKETFEVPDVGRYKLHNEIDDCIVCDKCAKVCPVDCIEIEPIKSSELIGFTSNGMKKRIYPAKFDIDMSKCCFCGLCTTVCPTECLTMTKNYDFSVFDLSNHKFSFSEMSEQEITKIRSVNQNKKMSNK